MTEEDRIINIQISEIIGKEIKDYCNDLNAMQDVWQWCRQVLGTEHKDSLHWEGVRDLYGEKLEEYARNKIHENGGGLHYVLPNLSAREKAKCFVSCMETINRSNKDATVTEV